MRKDKIAILLSTYNGEKYVEEQINSIINQDYNDWKLYIRDDGSNDSTTEIIRKYCEKYDNIVFLEGAENVGAALSFMDLLSKVNSEYYMFCDQDDIWLKNKVSSLYNVFLQNENAQNNLLMVFSDATVVDQDLNEIDRSLWNYNKLPPYLILKKSKYISIFNCAPGCTMMFNHQLKIKLNDYDTNILMHDWYAIIKALQYGTIKYIDTSLMLYRQHSNNVLGANRISFKDRIIKIFLTKKSIQSQMNVFKFVTKYTEISFFKFYILKFKFNILRFFNNSSNKTNF
ncbi:glycosyltransferase family 2 protein [Chryseobacterium scophthalmum]|uniref:Rhamnosyltransferase n=1 Tax=Chryseobacterium scophthalmum TaxID=59733 RepID=A0A1N6I9H0_9FLAO|nr:glycosyltransferase family 2 protein [Chryseobacterium scophthalmum]SIO28650.1 rhamnosyltransferase [Chryseobacterium scophthalmum]